MTNTLRIDDIARVGACAPHCIKLREIFPDGTIVFDMANYPQIRDKQVNVMWATPLLSRPIQLGLAKAWYDRALAGSSPSWKTPLRTLVDTPEANSASSQLSSRLAERRTTDATNALATAVAGVGYAAAAVAVKFAEVPVDTARTMAAMVVLSQWCAQAASINESKTMEEVLDELQASVFKALEDHGATIPV
jgi:hypothetical protein